VSAGKKRCARCDTLPKIDPDSTKLLLWPPLGHTLAKLKGAAQKVTTVEDIEDGIVIDLGDTKLTAVLDALAAVSTRGESADTNCLLTANESQPTLDELGGVMSLRKLVALKDADWLVDVLASDRLDTFFQPIVDAKTPTRPYAHECLLRWRDEANSWKAPLSLFETARDADLLFQLDRRAREINIRNAAARGVSSKIFLNFMPTAIYDPRNCLQATQAVIDEVGIEPCDVVFEVVETEKIEDSAHLKSIMDYYKSHGYGVALDDLGSGYSTLQLLGELLPDYVKLDMELIRGVHQNRFKSELVRRIIDLAHGFDIRVVAEGIEVQEEAAWLMSQEVDFMQGYFFAKPAKDPVSRLDRRQKN